MKKKFLLPTLFLLLLLSALWMEERRHYEILHSTVLSSANLTEHKLTLVVHSVLPIDREQLAREVVADSMRLNAGQPRPYFELEIYRTAFHYRFDIPYDTILCDENGKIVQEIRLN